MDTRSKIVSIETALTFAPGTFAVASGRFDPLLAGHARRLQALADRAAGAPLLVVVIDAPGALVSARARAEVVAALGCVHTAVIVAAGEDAAPEGSVDQQRLLSALRPLATECLSGLDAELATQLAERAHGRR
jgi:hypothetical protein